jgi:sugar-specific transcriptional regulator TrmB
MEEIKTLLKRFDLNEREIALYTSSLSIGEANMTDLAKKAGLKRPTAYLVFKSLESKGLMGSFRMRKGLKFVATKPETLLTKTKNQLEELQSLMPRLKALGQHSEIQPKIYYYEGKEGYLIATEDSLKECDSIIRHIGSLAEIHKVIGVDYDLKHYVPTRLKNNISIKSLYFKSQVPDDIKERLHSDELREMKYLPEKYLYQASMLIYGNKVAIFSSKKELITVIVESEQIAESERQKFDLIWDLLKD